MSEHGKNVKKVYAPGIWLDDDMCLHLDGAEYCKGQGVPPTEHNIRMAEEAFKNMGRQYMRSVPIVDLFDKAPSRGDAEENNRSKRRKQRMDAHLNIDSTLVCINTETSDVYLDREDAMKLLEQLPALIAQMPVQT